MNDGDRKGLQHSLREAWLGVLGGAEQEAARAAQRLLDAVGVRHDGESPPTVKDAVRELAERVKHNRDELERRVEEGVRTAVSRVRRPIQAELDTLRARVEELQSRIEARIERERTRQPPRD